MLIYNGQLVIFLVDLLDLVELKHKRGLMLVIRLTLTLFLDHVLRALLILLQLVTWASQECGYLKLAKVKYKDHTNISC